MTGHCAPERVLQLPAQVLLVAVNPEQQLLLGALGFTGSVRGGVTGVRLKVVSGFDAEIGGQGGAKQDAEVHVLCFGVRTGRGERALDHVKVGIRGTAHVGVPLVLLKIGEYGGLGCCHWLSSLVMFQ